MEGLGTELPQRSSYVWTLAITALIFAIPCLRIARRAWTESGALAVGAGAMAVVMALLLVVTPLLIARSIHSRRTFVSSSSVSVTNGIELRQQITIDELTEIRVRFSGNGTSFLRNEQVFLIGPLTSGKLGQVVVSRMYVATLRPLLDRLAVEVAERPELLSGDVERGFFEHALKVTP